MIQPDIPARTRTVACRIIVVEFQISVVRALDHGIELIHILRRMIIHNDNLDAIPLRDRCKQLSQQIGNIMMRDDNCQLIFVLHALNPFDTNLSYRPSRARHRAQARHGWQQ